MKKHLLVLGMASIFALSGCHGISKVEYAKFKEKADAAVKDAKKVDYISYKGKYDEEKISFSTNQGLASYSVAEGVVALALGSVDRVDAWTLSESSSLTYYTGLGFKVVSADVKYEYDSKGFLAKVDGKLDGKQYNFSVSHKFVK